MTGRGERKTPRGVSRDADAGRILDSAIHASGNYARPFRRLRDFRRRWATPVCILSCIMGQRLLSRALSPRTRISSTAAAAYPLPLPPARQPPPPPPPPAPPPDLRIASDGATSANKRTRAGSFSCARGTFDVYGIPDDGRLRRLELI